jgi:hypothetical protein
MERRSQLIESFSHNKKPLRPIVNGSNAQLLPPSISDAFDSVTGPFPVRPGGARAPSLRSSGPFNPLRHPSARRLITRHSRPSTFNVSFLPTPLSTFSVRSLPIPRSASDCRRPDAMGRNRLRRVRPELMPYITAVPHCAVLSVRARLPMGSSRGHRDPQHVVAGHIDAASRRARIASAYGVPGGGELAEALRGRRENREGAPRDVRRGRSVLAMMILEGMNCLDVQ